MIPTPEFSGTSTSRRRRRRRGGLLALFLALPTEGHCLRGVFDTRSCARGVTTGGRASSNNHEARLRLQSQRQESAEGGSVPGVLRDVVIEKIEELGGGKVQQVRATSDAAHSLCGVCASAFGYGFRLCRMIGQSFASAAYPCVLFCTK